MSDGFDPMSDGLDLISDGPDPMCATGSGPAAREGFLLRISASPAGVSGRACSGGVGEVAPLAGLHAESCGDAKAQLALLCRLLPGVQLPPTLTLLQVSHNHQPCNALNSIKCSKAPQRPLKSITY